MSSPKSLNKLPNTRGFIAAKKWTVRSNGVVGFISSQRTETCDAKNSREFFVDHAIFCLVKTGVSKREGQIQKMFDERKFAPHSA